ncbi:hypothetical protein [Nocardioides sp. W7]|uniref:hypothetical protein n=1 Tax=Nocardioides sp. W7 TaxID=2931390 RepID=UPI001FD2FB4B|nr:hypothetical protein [Nocardioides sp. W7]
MEDETQATFLDVPIYVLVSGLIEIVGCLLVVVACLTVVRRGPAALLGALGALLAGASNALTLAAYRNDEWWLHERFWELTTYGRAVGLAVLGLALVLALLRARRVSTSSGPSQHQ